MQYTAALLTGGTAADITPATYAALLATGKFNVTIDGTLYENVNPDFTGITTTAQLTAAIQTAIQTATSSTETFTLSTDHYICTSADTTYISAVSAFSAPTDGSAVDLSSDTYLDMAANATVTAVSAALGYTLTDLYTAAALEIFDDATDTTMDQNWFRKVVNDGYRIARQRMKEVDPNFDVQTGTEFDITAISDESEQEFALSTYAPNAATILRVDYVDDADTYTDETTPIPETEWDEKIYKSGLRWCKVGGNLVIRGIYDDIDNVNIRYHSGNIQLIAATDRPTFPNPDHHSILVDYVVAMWHKKENLETDFRLFLGEAGNPKSGVGFYGKLMDVLDDIESTDEPPNERVKYTTGIVLD